MADAVRHYLEQREDAGDAVRAAGEAARDSYACGPGDHRIAQLEADLRLTPEERVSEAEETANPDASGGRDVDWLGVLVFYSYED